MGVPNMRLGVVEPPHGVGWGVGARWSEVASCGPVSGIWPIFPKICCRTPILATQSPRPYTAVSGPQPIKTTPQHASGSGGTTPWGGGGGEVE